MENHLSKDKIIILKRILILAIPSMIEMFLNTLVNVADTIMIGRPLGSAGISAMALANQIIFPVVFIFGAFNTGTTAIVARHIGAMEDSKANEGVTQSLILNFSIGIVLMLIMFLFYERFIRLFPAEERVILLSMDYLRIVIFSQFFMLIAFAISSSLRGAGDTRTPMFVNGAINILNIIGNYFLIYGVWIFPEMGISGAALSTTISRAIGALFLIYILLKGNRRIALTIDNIRINLKMMKRILNIGWSAAIEQFFMQTSFMVINFIIISLGKVSHAIFNIVIRIESISFMPAFGISIAATTLVGQYLGSKDEELAVSAGNISAVLGVILGVVLGIVFLIFPKELVSIFISEKEVIEAAVIPLRMAAFQEWAIAVMLIYAGALRGAGDTRRVMMVTIFRVWGLFVPFTYIFVNFTKLGIIGVFIATLTEFIVTAALFYLRFKSRKWIGIEV